ncbi:hypothetical protein [Spiroplasma endosymbiont of Megaselia nigra]|uniref:hypothetical protein n=1 Tax=Spiroplasma endosymbiont of Megaselia nigra TaxID=2478537 RepID=UPI000F8885D1|nr:hypothetical protein [Spiroplasma endosymbiont of Megaselia nigra]RUO85800.1 hypothetical protein D9R21_06695 [Spiroplasma endosymbiont of Megaselia nigra]
MENITNNETILKLNNNKIWILKNNIKTLTKSWRFLFKIIIGLLPIISIIVFTSVSLSLTLWSKHHGIFPKSWVPKYETKLAELQSWSDISISFMVIFRNLTLYTSYSTLLFSAFFLNSAFNTLKEGKGRYDNSKVGLLTMVVICFTLFFYNLSLPITGDFKSWLPIQWMSMFLQHSLIPLLGVIYYFVFYQHHDLSYNKITMLRWWGYSLATILGYFLVFTIFGYILKVTNSWKPWPDMSFLGYFPYDFMEFTNPKASYTNGKVPMAIQTIVVYTTFALIISGCYFGFYFAQNKISSKQTNQLQKQLNLAK